MIVYVDTSFLVAAYIPDAHSAEVTRRLSAKPRICLTPFNRSELANATYRQAFLGRLSLAAAQLAWNSFEGDFRAGIWEYRDFPDQSWETCAGLAQRYCPLLGVRTLDSLHVACALELRAQKFWTFDERQAKLAEAVGLDTTA
ncbi:MAG: type II toxin-antitoxin system VapC family toxin [Terracidiphilus sp.]